MNENKAKAALIDGLNWRKRACNIATAIWNTAMSYELSETSIQTDTNMDGVIGSDNEQFGAAAAAPAPQEETNND